MPRKHIRLISLVDFRQESLKAVCTSVLNHVMQPLGEQALVQPHLHQASLVPKPDLIIRLMQATVKVKPPGRRRMTEVSTRRRGLSDRAGAQRAGGRDTPACASPCAHEKCRASSLMSGLRLLNIRLLPGVEKGPLPRDGAALHVPFEGEGGLAVCSDDVAVAQVTVDISPGDGVQG
jgi:hypothetical protein